MWSFLLFALFPVTAVLIWLLLRKMKLRATVQVLFMALGLSIVQFLLFSIGAHSNHENDTFFWSLAFIYACYYIPSMLILSVFFIILRMMRDEPAPK